MGICSSCDASNVATARLILLDGRLQEFTYPVKASYVLRGDPTCFVCDSDEMEFDDAVSAIQELQLGGLYFVLPRSKLKRKLRVEEMATASSALMKPCGRDRRCKCRKKVMDFEGVVRDRGRTVGDTGTGTGTGTGVKGRRRRFESKLGSIRE